MMVKQKDKGTRFEREVVEFLEKNLPGSKWRRIPMSGALGQLVNDASLSGDVIGMIPGFPRVIRAECKAGYNNSQTAKSMSIKKEWLDKIKIEAIKSKGFPVLFGKFDNVARNSGVKYFVVMDLEDFIFIMRHIMNMAGGEDV